MTTPVDLRELAIDRGERDGPKVQTRRHLLTRYVLPMLLVMGFVALLAWALREMVFPPRSVTVMPVIATTAQARQEGTPLFQAAGWIEPRPTPVRVAALAPGVVAKLLVVEDQAVTAGEPIAELVNDDAQLAHESAIADLQLRTAELEEVESQRKAAETRFQQPVHLEAALGEAEAHLAKIDTLLKNLPFQMQRAVADQAAAAHEYKGKRAAEGVVAGIQIDIAKSKLDSAQALVGELGDREVSLQKEQTALAARRDALRTQLKLLVDETKEVEGAAAHVKAAEARVEQARVAVAEAKLRLDRMTIPAPIDGRIFRLIAQPGARLGGGSSQTKEHDGSTVVTMYRPDQLQVRVDVRFEDLPKIALNQSIEINNPALSSPLIGSVLFVSSEADIQKNTLQVKVAIPDPPPMFKPEMLVDVTFLAPKPPDRSEEPTTEVVLYVPGQLVQQGEAGSFVWVADQSDGVARQMAVQTKDAAAGLVEITSGLKTTCRLIVGGSDGLRDGTRIKVTGEDSSLGRNGVERNEPRARQPLERLPNLGDE